MSETNNSHEPEDSTEKRFFLQFIDDSGEMKPLTGFAVDKDKAFARAGETANLLITDGVDGPVVWPMRKMPTPSVEAFELYCQGYFQWVVTLSGFGGSKTFQFDCVLAATKFMRKSFANDKWDSGNIERKMAYTLTPR